MCLGSGAAFGAMAIFGKLAYGDGRDDRDAARRPLRARRPRSSGLWSCAGGGAREVRRWAAATSSSASPWARAATRSRPGCFFAALERIDASLLSLLLYTFPAIVAVAAVALGRERIDGRRVAALGLAFGGLVLVMAGAGAGALDPLGAALGLGAAVVYSTYILVSDGIVGTRGAAGALGARAAPARRRR